MKAAKIVAILFALPLLLTCELFSGPNDRENPKDPLNPNYAGWFGIKTVDSTNDVGMYPSMKVSGANVFISYFDAMFGHTKFANSSDGAITWTNKRIDTSANTTGNPSALAIRPKGSLFDIAVVYQDLDNLHAKKSPDSGVTWADPATMQPHSASTVLHHCSLAAGTGTDDTYYASYYAQGAVGGKLWFAKSSDGGGDWSAGTGVDLATEDVGKFNSIAVSGKAVFIAYQNSTSGKIVMTNMITGETGWKMPPAPVGNTSATTLGGTSVAATDAANVYVVYFDDFANLAFAKSSNGGGSFFAPSVVNSSAGISPSIAISAGAIYVSHFHAASGDLLFTRSDDLGATWINPPVVVDKGLGPNQSGKSTSIAVDGTSVYIAYYDATNGDLKVAKSIDNGDTW